MNIKRLFPILASFLLTAMCAPSAFSATPPSAYNHWPFRTTPVMGWSSWSFVRMHPTGKKIRAQAKALHTSGLQGYGYDYVNLDDWWYECPGKPMSGAGATGRLTGKSGPLVGKYGRYIIKTSEFPSRNGVNGIKALATYVHSLGLKFGIYRSPGISKQALVKNTRIKGTKYTAREIAMPNVSENNYNCGDMVAINFTKPGAQAYLNSVVDRFAKWGVDFIKVDGITNANVPSIKAWRRAIAQSGRNIVLHVTEGTFTTAIGSALDRYVNGWVGVEDIECYSEEKGEASFPLTCWKNVKTRLQAAAVWQPFVRVGHYDDFDSVEVGNGSNDGLTPNERKFVLSLWALGSSPLILGSDLTHLNKLDLSYLENRSVIAMDQDSIAAKRVIWLGPVQVFMKTQPNGDVFFGMFNTTKHKQKASVSVVTVGLPWTPGVKRRYVLTNLWTHRNRTVTSPTIHAIVPAHGVVLYEYNPMAQGNLK